MDKQIFEVLHDKNTYLEVLLEYLNQKDKYFSFMPVGHSIGHEEFGFYHFWHEKTLRHGIVLSDTQKYFDKRVKTKINKEKRCVQWLLPLSPKHKYMSKEVFDDICDYIEGKQTTIKFSSVKPKYADDLLVDVISEYLATK